MALGEDREVHESRQLNMGNSSQAPMNDSTGTEEKELAGYASVIRAMIRHENEVTNNRLTWMLVLQGFLFVASASFWKIHWLPFVAIATLGILTCVSVFYSCWLSGRARGHLRWLWNQRIEKNKELANKIPPVAGDFPGHFSFPIPLHPWVLLPWGIGLCWLLIILSGIVLQQR